MAHEMRARGVGAKAAHRAANCVSKASRPAILGAMLSQAWTYLDPLWFERSKARHA